MVYMPYFNTTLTQSDLYIETVDVLQGFIDQHASTAPIKIVGDFNAQLPARHKLHKKWYSQPGYNRHSVVLYYFLVANDLTVSDFTSRQPVLYTYFCHKSNIFTWIDHVISSSYDNKNVSYCEIIPLEPGNTSDHLPIKCAIHIPVSPDKNVSDHELHSNGKDPAHVNWNMPGFTYKYKETLEDKLSNLPVYSDGDDLDQHIQNINDAMHDAARPSGPQHIKSFKPKPYWCPELSRLRDRKRMWWHIWDANGRPRHGLVYECYKGVKKMFRKVSRRQVQSVIDNDFQSINACFRERKITAFWNKLKRKVKSPVNSSLDAQSIGDCYKVTMGPDDSPLDTFQQHVSLVTSNTFDEWKTDAQHEAFTDSQIDSAIIKLRKNVSPGIDGITAEHLIYGNCESLRSHLVNIYNALFTHIIVPSVLSTGIIIPILKKPTLDTNVPNNYRPITLGSTHGKLLEILMLPQDAAHVNQFGFRNGRGTAMACNFLNDLLCLCESKGSPVYLCSLDAEKCFDTIWHDGLFYKLMGTLPRSHWLFLYQWYKCMTCIVKWKGSYSQPFRVYRGTKQGSIISPTLFNIFINDLLVELANCDIGIRIDDDLFNSFAYADDISLACLTIPDLQKLINICYNYSTRWRFKFGIKKTLCMTSGKSLFKTNPVWTLGSQAISTVESLEILGNIFTSNVSSDAHIRKRTHACRRAMYSLASVGCSYPGLSTDAKVHLWKSVGLPSLLYGMETMTLNDRQHKILECTQSATIKNVLGFSKRCHHSNLLRAVNLPNVTAHVYRNVLSLWWRIFQVDNPGRRLSIKLLNNYVQEKRTVPGTLLHRIVGLGQSPIKSLFDKQYCLNQIPYAADDAIIDSLRYLVHHENFIKPYSEEHILANLLIKSF